jgi:transposase
VTRCQSRPIAHVAAEAGISRQCLSKWVRRYRTDGEAGLVDRRSRPHVSPTQLPDQVVARIEAMRRDRKWSARLIAVELRDTGVQVSTATVGRWLVRLGLNDRRHLDPTGASNRAPQPITADRPGHMVHIDVKKVGRIPDGGGWRATGRGSTQAKAVEKAKTAGARAGYVYLHSVVDGHSRLAYTEALPDETAATTIAFWRRARAFLAEHGITRIDRVDTTFASLDYTRMRNIQFQGNMFNGVNTYVANPVDVTFTQATASNRWLVPVNVALPFDGWAKNVQSVIATGPITNANNARVAEMPWVQAAMGTTRKQVAVNWGAATKGTISLRVRMDNPD